MPRGCATTSTPVVSGFVGVGQRERRLTAREQHDEDLLEVVVHEFEGLKEAVAHLAVDGADDLLQRRAARVADRRAGAAGTRAERELLVLLDRDRVDGPRLAIFLRSLCAASTAVCTVLNCGSLERALESTARAPRRSGCRRAYLDLELGLLDADIGHGLIDDSIVGLSRSHGLLGRVDGRAQRLGVRLLEAGAVPQPNRPVLGALEQTRSTGRAAAGAARAASRVIPV